MRLVAVGCKKQRPKKGQDCHDVGVIHGCFTCATCEGSDFSDNEMRTPKYIGSPDDWITGHVIPTAWLGQSLLRFT